MSKIDLLRMDFINSRRWRVKLLGDDSLYDLELIDVQTGLLRFDVCGKLQRGDISDIGLFVDWDGNEYEPDDFYTIEEKRT